MTGGAWVAVAVVVWLIFAGILALIIGRAIAIADRRERTKPTWNEDQL